MRHRELLACGLTVTLLTASHAAPPQPGGSDGSAVHGDATGKGAVLCVSEMYAVAWAAGQECFKGQDAAFQAELHDSISRTDDFKIKNSERPVTKAQLEAQRAQALQQLQASGQICQGFPAKLYEVFRAHGAAALHAQTSDLLSIPREPVMNPCM